MKRWSTRCISRKLRSRAESEVLARHLGRFPPRYRASWQTGLGAVPKDTVEDNTQAWIGDHCMAAHLVPGVSCCRIKRLPRPIRSLLRHRDHDPERVRRAERAGDDRKERVLMDIFNSAIDGP